MSKNIKVEEDVYDLLVSLKQDSRDSFTRVIRRHLPRPLDTAGELLDAYEHAPAPKIDWEVLDKIATGRGRRSGGRK
jgi:predicted CopG family antitoxin